MASVPSRYSTVAIALHWLIAGLVIANIGLAELTDQLSRQERTPYMGLHKAFGLLVLALTLARIVWRLSHRPPPLPHSVPRWQRRAAGISHGLFYVLLLALPLSGWLWMSAIPAPIIVVDGLTIPLWPLAGQEAVGAAMRQTHQWLGQAMIALVLLHLLGVAKHLLIDKDGTLRRILPMRPA